MTQRDAELFFESYADAFSHGSVERLCRSWAYPAFFAARGKSAALTEVEFVANTGTLCHFYDQQGMARAEATIRDFSPLTRTTASVKVGWKLYDSERRKIAGWDHIYVLSETADGVKAVAALPDGELDAWAERGTPLGRW